MRSPEVLTRPQASAQGSQTFGFPPYAIVGRDDHFDWLSYKFAKASTHSAKVKAERRKEQRHAAAAAAGREPGRRGNPNWSKSDARPARATAGGRVLLLLGG